MSLLSVAQGLFRVFYGFGNVSLDDIYTVASTGLSKSTRCGKTERTREECEYEIFICLFLFIVYTN